MNEYTTLQNGVVRPLTDEEIAVKEASDAQRIPELEAMKAAAAQAAAAKTSARAKLKALGLTDDEIAALIP